MKPKASRSATSIGLAIQAGHRIMQAKRMRQKLTPLTFDQEQQAIADFLASRGPTRCPTRYLRPVGWAKL